MKKFIYLFLTVLIVSCSNDPIIGEWNAYRLEEKFSSEENSPWNVSTIHTSTNIFADGTFDSGGCTGVWESTGNTPFKYKFYYNCGQFEELVEAIFYCNNNIIRFTVNDTIGQVYAYWKKPDYNTNNCNEVEYFGN